MPLLALIVYCFRPLLVGLMGEGVRNRQGSGGDIGGCGVLFSPAVASPVAQILEGPGETAFCAGVRLESHEGLPATT